MTDTINTREFERMTFVAVPRELDDGTPMIAVVWQPRPLEWVTVWTTAFPTASDRDTVYDDMWQRRSRWHDWGHLALFAGPQALNRLLLEEVSLPPETA